MAKEKGSGGDSGSAVQPGKGVDPKQVQAGIERRSVPEPPPPPPAPAAPRGGWFGSKR